MDNCELMKCFEIQYLYLKKNKFNINKSRIFTNEKPKMPLLV